MPARWFYRLALAALALATYGTCANAAAPVRVYTNEDIERLAPLPTQSAPLVGFDKERWEYVIQFLEREYELLNAEREFELAWAILRAEVEASERRARDRPRPRLGSQRYPRRY